MALTQEMVRPKSAQTPIPMKNVRRARRVPMAAAVRIGWMDANRQMRYRTARGVDISENGVGLRIPVALAPATLVHLELMNCGVSAVGQVRHCNPLNAEWRAGIEVTASFPSGETQAK